MAIGDLQFNPAVNPAVLDTLTWNEKAVAAFCTGQAGRIHAFADAVWLGTSAQDAAETAMRVVEGKLEFFPNSASRSSFGACVLARCPDEQRVFVCVGPAWAQSTWVADAITTVGDSERTAHVIPVNARTARYFLARVAPGKGPTALGRGPRLGVGSRQTVNLWPGVFEAIRQIGTPSEIVQNSAYREVAPMSVILSPPGDEVAYLPGHGSLSVGHTGSSIEGLWLAGVVAALEHGFDLPFGADLDHIPVKGENEHGLEKAKWIIASGRDYTFFTLDTSALFNLGALTLDGVDLDNQFEATVPARERVEMLQVHARNGLASEQVKRFSAAYYKSIKAAADLFRYISSLRKGESFDFEFSLDEGLGLTGIDELTFVLEELHRRDARVDFIAPNVGFEKRLDYRLPDGLPGLEARVRRLSQAAAEYGTLIDFHSGSDKCSDTYRCISRATGGALKLKVSGKLQLILAEVLADADPAFFQEWWDWTLSSAKEEACRGSSVAAEYVGQVEARMAAEGTRFMRSPRDRVFTDFAFMMVGAKDRTGRFLARDRFYSLSRSVKEEYARRVKEYLVVLAHDLSIGASASSR